MAAITATPRDEVGLRRLGFDGKMRRVIRGGVGELRVSSMRVWLFKSEPECFSFADLTASPGGTTGWDGVRNYQARNRLRDEVRKGDLVLYYHSSASPPAIAGLAEVVESAHADPTAFDPTADHYDPKSRREEPTWVQVSIKAVRTIDPPIGLPALREVAGLEGMELPRRGSRLSIQPVRPEEWTILRRLIDGREKPRKA